MLSWYAIVGKAIVLTLHVKTWVLVYVPSEPFP